MYMRRLLNAVGVLTVLAGGLTAGSVALLAGSADAATCGTAVPAGSNGGRTLRLRGKGITGGSAPDGDLLVTLRVVLPDSTDEEFKDLMRKWQAEKPYSPRRDMV